MPALINSLRRQFWNITDHHLIDGAVADALINYFADPGQFNPTEAGLFTWLRQCAKNNLLDALQAQRNYQDREKSVEFEGVELVYQVKTDERPDPEDLLVERTVNTQTMEKLREILPDPTDLKMVVLMMEGIRETYVFADLLGITDRRLEEQKKLVKQHKDRLKKTIQRNYNREGGRS
jgi:DNA-directed RNA polymerase specialized sigma24 family protein